MSKFIYAGLMFVCLTGLSFRAFACEKQTWKTDTSSFEVCYNEKLKAFASANCESKPCEIEKWIERAASIRPNSKPTLGTKNPGADICRILGGEIITARDESKSEIAFCQANDKSIVALTDLVGLSSRPTK